MFHIHSQVIKDMQSLFRWSRRTLISISVQNALDEDVRQVVMKVSRIFVQLYAREIKIIDCDADIIDAAKALCLMEKVFPPTFMDVMSHLMIHLV